MRITQYKRRYNILRSEIKTLIFNKYFYVEKEPIFKLNSGVTSKYYFDTRHLMLNWIPTRTVADLLRYRIIIDTIEDNLETNDMLIGGLETGAILLTMSIINNMAINGFYVRKQDKDHGNQKRIVTPKDLNGKRVIIIDDIITSGLSVNICRNVIKYYYPECDIWKVYCLIDRSNELNFDPFKHWNEEDINDTSFFSIYDSEDDFINLIKAEEDFTEYNKSTTRTRL